MANQEGGGVKAFRINGENGDLSMLGGIDLEMKPTCLAVVEGKDEGHSSR